MPGRDSHRSVPRRKPSRNYPPQRRARPPSRLYVNMVRDLDTMGFAAIRFDFSGIGNSEVYDDNLFEKKRD